jgi:hypothetical protein
MRPLNLSWLQQTSPKKWLTSTINEIGGENGYAWSHQSLLIMLPIYACFRFILQWILIFVLHALWYKSSVDVFIFSSIYKIVWMPIIQMEQPLTKNRATNK